MKIAELLSTQILDRLGEKQVSTTFLESGSTSNAFKVVSNHSKYVLRVASPHAGKTASYETDFQIRNSLFQECLPVAKPIATNESFQTDIPKKWALDEFREGSHPNRGSIPTLVSKQLGFLLQAMHELPVSAFGRLDNSRLRLAGVAETPESGLLTRFESPWPFTSASLDDHPCVGARPSLKVGLQRIKSDLTAFVQESKPAVVHSDIHEGQLLVLEGRLTALLDFNEAVAGRREWDLGSYLYFHGKQCLSDLLDGYSSSSIEKSDLTDRAVLASILVALHHGNRGAVLKRRHRIEASINFLQNILD